MNLVIVALFFFVMLFCSPPSSPFKDPDNVHLKIEVPKKPGNFKYCVNETVNFKITVVLSNLVKKVSVFYDENGESSEHEIKTNETNKKEISFKYKYRKKGRKKVKFIITFRESPEERDTVFDIKIGVKPTIKNEKNLVSLGDIELGKAISLSVEHEEFDKATYRWFKDLKLLKEKEKQSLIINPLKSDDAGIYYCIVRTDWGQDTSKIFNLSFSGSIGPPKIQIDPQSLQVTTGSSARFTIKATGEQIKYQWQKNEEDISGAHDTFYEVKELKKGDDAIYRCIVSNSAGEVISEKAVLEVIETKIAPKITRQPQNLTVKENENANFSITAYGTNLEYQWQRNGNDIDNDYARTNAYTFKVSSDDDGKMFRCVVRNSVDTKESNTVILTVLYSVIYDKKGGNGYIPPDTLYARGESVPLPKLTRDGFEFKGWSDGSKDHTKATYEMGPKSVTFTAIWKETSVRETLVFKKVSAGYNHSMFLTTKGILWACGGNRNGQLGDGTTVDRNTPVKIVSGVKDIDAGNNYSLILKTDNTIWACGFNNYGQLGDGTTDHRTNPIHIMSGVKNMSAGLYHSLILKTDSTLWACGNNNFGQLGDGTNDYRSTPVKIMSSVKSMSAGEDHSLILRTDGTVWACGDNHEYQLGNEIRISRSNPVQFMSGVKDIFAGPKTSLILKIDGTLWACGFNSFNQLISEGVYGFSTPVKIMSSVESMSAGFYHTLILRTDGTLWVRGRNRYGQLGDGTNTNRSTSIQIMSSVKSITAGEYHSLIFKTDGTLWACGRNLDGQLGDGTNIDRSTPTQIRFKYDSRY